MKNRVPIISLSLFILGFISMFPCDKELYCDGPLSSYMGYPLLWFLIWIPITLLALTLNNQKHKTWLMFTGIFFAGSMVLVFMTPEYGHGVVSVDRELVNWFLAGLYSFISVIYFIVQYLKRRKVQV